MLSISREQVRKRLLEDNPWWQPPHHIPKPYSQLRPRPYLEAFASLARNRSVQRAVVLMGPRRVGKTVLLHHLLQELLREGHDPRLLCYYSVDHPLYNGLGLEQLAAIYQEAAGLESLQNSFLILDEIQYLKDWEVHVKAWVDRTRDPKLIVSGSAAAALRLKSLESGAGRMTDFLLPPLTFYEYLRLNSLDGLVSEDDSSEPPRPYAPDVAALNEHFFQYLNYGGYPELVFSGEARRDPQRYVKSDIIDKVLLRDLPSMYGISDIQELNSLFTALAYNSAAEISPEALSKQSGASKVTIKRYIEYLEAAFLIKIVHRVDQKGKRFQRATHFKVYLTNPSLRTALFSPVRPDEDLFGHLVETAIFAQFFYTAHPIYYARWSRGEVDVVTLNPDLTPGWAAEVKWSDRYASQPEKLPSLISFCHRHSIAAAMVTTRSIQRNATFQNINLAFVPASLYCYFSGQQAVSKRLQKTSLTFPR